MGMDNTNDDEIKAPEPLDEVAPKPAGNGKAFVKAKKTTKPKSKLNEDTISRLKQAIRAGAYAETAAAYVGIDRSTLQRWLKTGARTKKGVHWKLVKALQHAWAEAEMRDLINIDRCAMGRPTVYERDPDTGAVLFNKHGYPVVKEPGLAPSWQASAWRLERKFGGRWNKPEKVDQNMKVTGPGVQVYIPKNGREADKGTKG